MKWFVAVEEGKYHYLEKKKKLRRRRTADLKARYEVHYENYACILNERS